MWPTYPLITSEREPFIVPGSTQFGGSGVNTVTPPAGWKPGDVMWLHLTWAAPETNYGYQPDPALWTTFTGGHRSSLYSFGVNWSRSANIGSSLIGWRILTPLDGGPISIASTLPTVRPHSQWRTWLVRDTDPIQPITSVVGSTIQNSGVLQTSSYDVTGNVQRSAPTQDRTTRSHGLIQDASGKSKHLLFLHNGQNSSFGGAWGWGGLTGKQFLDTLYGGGVIPEFYPPVDDDPSKLLTYSTTDGNSGIFYLERLPTRSSQLLVNGSNPMAWARTNVDMSAGNEVGTLRLPSSTASNFLHRSIHTTATLEANKLYTYSVSAGDTDNSTFTGQYRVFGIQMPGKALRHRVAWGGAQFGGPKIPWAQVVQGNDDGEIIEISSSLATPSFDGVAPRIYSIVFRAPASGVYTFYAGVGGTDSGNQTDATDFVDACSGSTARPGLQIKYAVVTSNYVPHVWQNNILSDPGLGAGFPSVVPRPITNRQTSVAVSDRMSVLRGFTGILLSKGGKAAPAKLISSGRDYKYTHILPGGLEWKSSYFHYVYGTVVESDTIIVPGTFGAPGKYYMELEVVANSDPALGSMRFGYASVGAENTVGPTTHIMNGGGRAARMILSTSSTLQNDDYVGGVTNVALGSGLLTPGTIVGFGIDIDTGNMVATVNGAVVGNITGATWCRGRCLLWYATQNENPTHRYKVNFRGPFLGKPAGYAAYDWKNERV